MAEPSTQLDRLGWLKWLWRSSIGSGVTILAVAAVVGDFFLAVAAVGMIIGGLADAIYRRDRPRWWALMVVAAILFVGGIYLSIENYQLSDVLHHIPVIASRT